MDYSSKQPPKPLYARSIFQCSLVQLGKPRRDRGATRLLTRHIAFILGWVSLVSSRHGAEGAGIYTYLVHYIDHFCHNNDGFHRDLIAPSGKLDIFHRPLGISGFTNLYVLAKTMVFYFPALGEICFTTEYNQYHHCSNPQHITYV